MAKINTERVKKIVDLIRYGTPRKIIAKCIGLKDPETITNWINKGKELLEMENLIPEEDVQNANLYIKLYKEYEMRSGEGQAELWIKGIKTGKITEAVQMMKIQELMNNTTANEQQEILTKISRASLTIQQSENSITYSDEEMLELENKIIGQQNE